jgi:hypothetical protein
VFLCVCVREGIPVFVHAYVCGWVCCEYIRVCDSGCSVQDWRISLESSMKRLSQQCVCDECGSEDHTTLIQYIILTCGSTNPEKQLAKTDKGPC